MPRMQPEPKVPVLVATMTWQEEQFLWITNMLPLSGTRTGLLILSRQNKSLTSESQPPETCSSSPETRRSHSTTTNLCRPSSPCRPSSWFTMISALSRDTTCITSRMITYNNATCIPTFYSILCKALFWNLIPRDHNDSRASQWVLLNVWCPDNRS